ncbi:MAG TPA: ankyrin repeat domain-containing protein [Actinomycetota bacterium]
MTSTSRDLFAAIEAGDVDAVRTILTVDPAAATSRDDDGVSALMLARYRFDRPLAEAVRSHVPELDVFEATTFGDLDRLVRLLDEEPGRATSWSGDGFTPLHFAAFFGQDEAVRLLLGRGADVEAHGTGWMTGTALNSAAGRGRVGIVESLLDAGADVDATQAQGYTALHGAAHNGDAATVRVLLARGADPARTTEDGRDALALAREAGDGETIELLRAAGG